MKGELWQECEVCGREPVCAQCFKCAKHCTCDADAKAIGEYHDGKQQNLHALLDGMKELEPVPSGIKFDVAGEKVDFSPFGGGVYEYYTPIIYKAPQSLAGKPGVEYYYYLGGEDSEMKTRFWVATPAIAAARKAAAAKFQAADAEKKATEKAASDRRQKKWEEQRARKTAKKNELEAKEKLFKEKIRSIDLSTMTKAEMLVALADLVKKGIVMKSYTKQKIIDTVKKYLSGKTEPAAGKHREEREYPDH